MILFLNKTQGLKVTRTVISTLVGVCTLNPPMTYFPGVEELVPLLQETLDPLEIILQVFCCLILITDFKLVL